MVIAAIDLSAHHIGIAVTDVDGVAAHPLESLDRHSIEHDLKAIEDRLGPRGVKRVIIGLPLNMNGSEGLRASAVRAFAQRLYLKTGLPVEFYDERLTSFEARERLRGLTMRRASRKRAVDAIAASLILEGWLESRRKGVGQR
jgi:putative Holliday junction resolvase